MLEIIAELVRCWGILRPSRSARVPETCTPQVVNVVHAHVSKGMHDPMGMCVSCAHVLGHMHPFVHASGCAQPEGHTRHWEHAAPGNEHPYKCTAPTHSRHVALDTYPWRMRDLGREQHWACTKVCGAISRRRHTEGAQRGLSVCGACQMERMPSVG